MKVEMKRVTRIISSVWLSPSAIRIVICGVTLLFAAVDVSSQSASSAGARPVVVNGTRLDDYILSAHERQYRTHIPNGRYWYDAFCGAWVNEGGPMRGLTLAGLNLGGPLRADASRGRTGVFINGRQLHKLDVMALKQLGPVLPGRYWVDAWGSVGYEGGPALFNLIQVARARSAASNRGGSGRRRSVLSTWDRTGVAVF